jgi:signal transduction histidine kinase
MDYLIDGILTYAKIDKINVREKVNVDEIVRNIINIIDVPYNSVVSIKMPVILGDRFRVQQLFQNIISNAIAHNDKGAHCRY